MAQIFHRSTNTIARVSIFGAVFLIGGLLWLTAQIHRSSWNTDAHVAREQLFAAAEAQGFTVDHHCYPHIAYKGARFKPTETHNVFTPLEAEALEVIKIAHQFLESLPEGWLGKTTGDVGALNDFYIKIAIQFLA